MKEIRDVEESRTQMTELVLPHHTNGFGSTFGGVIMSWMDICAAIAAKRHARRPAVTASVDELHFLRPISLGDTVVLDAVLTSVGETSMEVHVVVSVEPADGKPRFRTTQAFFTFVALGDDGRPTPVPRLSHESEISSEQREQAGARRVHRLEAKAKRREALHPGRK